MIYDIVIIGGGISGLYTAYNLKKKYPDKKVLILEKNNRFGGRIYTFKKHLNNTNYYLDLGAMRIGYHHKLMIKLIKNLKLYNKKINIDDSKSYIDISDKVLDKTIERNILVNKIFKLFESNKIKTLKKNELIKYTCREILQSSHLLLIVYQVQSYQNYALMMLRMLPMYFP